MLVVPGIDVQLPIYEVGGLPLHPLVIHAVVVLVPLTALGLIVMVTGVDRSRRYGPAVLLVAVGAAVSAFVALASGQRLRSELGLPGSQHFELGQYVPWAALALLGFVIALMLLDRRGGKRRGAAGKLVALAGVLVALGAVALTVLTGQAGAELVWS